MIFDVQDGNPNGDPDAGNLPRMDPETMQGLVTDVCLKRKVRDYIDVLKGDDGRFKIYVQDKGVALNTMHQRAYTALKTKSTGAKQDRETVDKARDWMCENFYDIRTFGAVMTTGVNCGQVRGPVQLTFGRSIDPIIPIDHSITRVAITREEDTKVVVSDEGEGTSGKTTEMGRKSTVPYGLYRAYGFFNPHFAEQSGFDQEDLSLLWQALQGMWDLDRSSSRGLMSCRGLYVFSHESKLGNAPAQDLFELVTVARNNGVEAPRKFADYTVTVDGTSLPAGVTLTRLVG
jgi:CRISPR-associated protein Csd2